MSRETWAEQEEREDREAEIADLMWNRPQRYQSKSTERNIRIGDDLYSERWIVAYATIRHRGVACMLTAASHADYKARPEHHEVENRSIDMQILWQANLFWINRQRKDRKCKLKKYNGNGGSVSTGSHYATAS